MSSSRLTRKVTVEGSKKITDTTLPRKSVFDRLGPGAVERSQSRREDYSDPVEKCRYWLKDGRCPFGSKCRYDHGSTSEGKSKLKIIRSIVSKNDEPVRVKRVHSPDADSSDHTSKKPTKRMKAESIKVTKESLREDSKLVKEHRRAPEEPKVAEKRQDVVHKRSTSTSGWNLQDNSDSEDGNEGKQLDWEVRGAMHHAREVALEERRNDLRRQIAKIDQHDEPLVRMPNVPLAGDSSPPYQEENVKPEKKKKSKSDKSKKKMKKKSHKGDAHRMEAFHVGDGDFGEKSKKANKSSGGKKKKKHSNDSDHEEAEVPFRKEEYESDVFQREYHETKRKGDGFHSPAEHDSRTRHSHESKREKNIALVQFEPEIHHVDKRNRSPHILGEARPATYEREHRSVESRGPKYERESRQMDRETRQLEREERQFERETRQMEREHQAQLEKESRQFERESQHLERESRKTQHERESGQVHGERESRHYEKASRQSQFERESGPPSFEREPRTTQFERESRQAPSRQQPFARETRSTHSEKETRPPYNERVPRSPPFDARSSSPSFERDARSSHQETRSPVVEKRSRQQQQVDQPRGEDYVPHKGQQTREKQRTGKATERVPENKIDRVKKKSAPQRSPSREKVQVVEHKESVREERKSRSKAVEGIQKDVKQKAKKAERQREAPDPPVPQEYVKSQKTKPGQEEKKRKGPRTPSPEFKQQLPLSLDMEASYIMDTSTAVSQRREKNDSRQRESQTVVQKEIKLAKKSRPVAKQQAPEDVSESSDSDSSSSSDESESEEMESGSTEEKEVRGKVRRQPVEREAEKKKEVPAKEPKRDQRKDKKSTASRDHSEHADETSERTNEDSKNVPEGREHHSDERKERASDYDRREEEKYYREHARDHRRTRDEGVDRCMEGRGSKDTRDPRDSRDHRDSRDYREFQRVDYRDPRERERFREFEERDRRHPFDARHDYRDGPPDFRGAWTRDMRGRDGYDGYDAREYNERRGEGRVGHGEFNRHYDRDRPHPDRGGRFREMEDRPDPGWHERRGERGYRESERYHEGRERYQDDGKTSRGKRSRAEAEQSHGDRKGHRKERKRGSGTPPESEEWDYEEGHSPASEVKEQQTSSRKRPKVSPGPPQRSDSVKRKKVSTPEPSNQDAAAKPIDDVEKKEAILKMDDKDAKKSRKDKDKKTKRRDSSDEETGTTKASAGTPDGRRTRETSKDKDVRKSKNKEQLEATRKSGSDVDGDAKERRSEVDSTKESEAVLTEETKTEKKPGEQEFSDWSDGSEGGEKDKPDGASNAEEKQVKSNVSKNNDDNTVDHDGSFEDVYDPISDDELEAIIADEKQESRVKETTQTLDIEDVDWSVLEKKTENVSEPGDYIKRFSAGNIFSRIGISSALAGASLTKRVQEKCSQDAPDRAMKDLLLVPDQKKLTIGALVAAEARKMKERENVVNDIGPCRRALCARRDFHIRKQLRRLTTTKLGKKLLMENNAVEPVDSELFALSVSIFRRGKTDVKEGSQPPPTPPSEAPQVLAC